MSKFVFKITCVKFVVFFLLIDIPYLILFEIIGIKSKFQSKKMIM